MSTRKPPVLIALVLLLSLVLLGMLAGCGGDGGTDKTTAAPITEKGATTAKTEETTKKGDSTTAMTFTTEPGGLDWPSDKMGDLPKLDAKIDAAMQADTNFIVSYSGLEKKDAEAYIEELKDKGYASTMEMTTAESIVYYGMNKKGDVVYVLYVIADGAGTVSFVPGA